MGLNTERFLEIARALADVNGTAEVELDNGDIQCYDFWEDLPDGGEINYVSKREYEVGQIIEA